MATGTTYSDREFLFRLQTLIIDGGTEVIRNIFDNRLQNQPLNVVLSSEKTTVNRLRGQKTISKAQYDLLYPSSGQSPTSSALDITLMVCLLRNLPSLGLKQNYKWNVPPQTGDTSVEADICRLRVCRNEVAHISSTRGFQKSTYQAKWSDIEQVLLRLNSTSPNPLANLSQTIDNYKNSPMDPAAEQRIRTINKQWQEMERGLETKMLLIEKDVIDTKKEVKNIEQNILGTKQEVKNIEQGLSDTKHDVTNIEEVVSDTTKVVKNIEQGLSDTKHDVTNVEQVVSGTRKVVKNIEQDVFDTKKDVKNIERNVIYTRLDLNKTKKDVRIVEQNVHCTRQDVRNTMQNVTHIEQDVGNTKRDVKGIKKDISEMKQDVKNIEQVAISTTENVHDVKQHIEVIEKDIESIKQEMPVQAEKEREKAYDTLKSNLQEDLILYYKSHHKNIPLSPLLEEDQPLLKFYEMPDILTVKVTRSRDGDRLEKKRVQALRDVFYKENKLCSNIYLTADAGYGKTAFSKKLALAWCHAKKPDKREIKHFSKDEVTAMGGFSFVFVVLLRESSSKCDIDDLIFYQILSQLPHVYSSENLRKILCEEICLVILDGLDEWTHPLNTCRRGESNIPHQRVRENTAVLTTTRPWKLSVIDLHTSQIDQKLELEGLSNDSAKKLKRSVISHLHGEQEKNKIDEYEMEFNMTVQENHKSDLTAIPLFLMYLLFLWYYKFSVGKSLADLYSSFIELLLSRTVTKDGIQIPNTETVQGNIVPCIDKKKLCKKLYTLLTTLGELAFDTLFSETKENMLVFDGCIAEKYLSEDELTFCLKTGIITQSKVQGDPSLQQKTKVSFAHKTMQEFLAALYINSAPDPKSVQEIVLSKCKCVKDILDMSKLFMFIVNISGKFSFSRELMKIINEDKITQEYRSSLQDGSFHPLKVLQDMYILCCKEIPRENEANICLQDVIIDWSCEQEEYRENLKQLTTRNKQNIRSVYINMSAMEDTPYNTARKVIDYFSLSDLENTEKIHYKGEYSDYILHLLNSSVKSLYLSCNWSSWSRSLSDKVTSLQKLEAIEISRLNMSHSELSLLLDFISQRDCLREIGLESLSVLTTSIPVLDSV